MTSSYKSHPGTSVKFRAVRRCYTCGLLYATPSDLQRHLRGERVQSVEPPTYLGWPQAGRRAKATADAIIAHRNTDPELLARGLVAAPLERTEQSTDTEAAA